MKALLVVIALGVASVMPLVPASAQSGPDSKPSLGDQKFLKEAAGGGAAEVQLGQLALERAASPEVKQLAQRMIDEHSKTNARLAETLAAQGVSVSSELPSEAYRSYEKLSKLSGASFDRAYLQDLVKDHRKGVQLYEEQARNGKDPALRQFAATTLPTLRDHLQQAERMAAR
jgi:putative membrane protein